MTMNQVIPFKMIEEEDATVFQTEGEKLRNSLEMDDLQLSILCQTFKLPFNIDTVIENGKYNFIYHFPYQTLVELVERTK